MHALLHHPARTVAVVLGKEEVERRLGHPVPVLVLGLEPDLVRLDRLRVPEEAQVDDRARVDRLRDGTVRECVAVDLARRDIGQVDSADEGERGWKRTDLGVPRVLNREGRSDLRLWVAEGDYVFRGSE